jgi:hypothetical protein
MTEKRIDEIKRELPAVWVEAMPQRPAVGFEAALKELEAWLLTNGRNWELMPNATTRPMVKSAAYCFVYNGVH